MRSRRCTIGLRRWSLQARSARRLPAPTASLTSPRRWPWHRKIAARRCSRSARSGRAHRVEELADLELEAIAVAGQSLRRGEYPRRGGAAPAGAAPHVAAVGGDLLSALGSPLPPARTLPPTPPLPFAPAP